MARAFILALLAALFLPLATAQRVGHPAAVGGNGFSNSRGFGFGYPFFYADYGTEPQPAVPPSTIVIEKKVMEPERPAEPLMIEWNGDRFVRYGSTQNASTMTPDYSGTTGPAMPPQSEQDLPPAVLVFRDGHRLEVSDYVTARGVLYARGDGYSQPSRNIQLTALDLSATFRANQRSGVKFVLPAGANEVVTRP